MSVLVNFIGSLSTVQLAAFALAIVVFVTFLINFIQRIIYWILICSRRGKYNSEWMDWKKWNDTNE